MAKLMCLMDSLAPPIVGNASDIDRAITLALRTHQRVEAPFDANRPCHPLLKDISLNVIDFLKGLSTPAKKHASRDKIHHLSSAYPAILGFPLQLEVQSPQVTVINFEGKGKGVVATDDIPANRIVTFYPNDILRIRAYDSSSKGGHCIFFSKSARHDQLASQSGGVEDAFGKYKFSIQNVDIYGDPTKYTNGCCGHMINDGDGPIQGANNCLLQPLFGGVCVAVITLVALREGEELFVSYGPHYWG